MGETLFHGPPYVHKGLHTKNQLFIWARSASIDQWNRESDSLGKVNCGARKVNSWHFESGISKSMPRGSYMWNLIKVGSWIHHLIRNWKSYLIWKWLTFHLGQVFMIVALTLSPFCIKIKAPFENFSNMKVVPLVPSFLEI